MDLGQDPEELVHDGVRQVPLLVSQLGLGQLHVPGDDGDRDTLYLFSAV